MRRNYWKYWLIVRWERFWGNQADMVNRVMASIDAEPVVLFTKRAKWAFWIRMSAGAALALFLFYTALTHGGPTP